MRDTRPPEPIAVIDDASSSHVLTLTRRGKFAPRKVASQNQEQSPHKIRVDVFIGAKGARRG